MYNNKKTAQFNWQVRSLKCDCMFVSIQNSQIYYDITTQTKHNIILYYIDLMSVIIRNYTVVALSTSVWHLMN